MELLFASSFLKLVRMGGKVLGPLSWAECPEKPTVLTLSSSITPIQLLSIVTDREETL